MSSTEAKGRSTYVKHTYSMMAQNWHSEIFQKNVNKLKIKIIIKN